MKKLLLTHSIFAILCFSNLVNAQVPNWVWAKPAGDYNTEEFFTSITSDSQGNLIAVGKFSGQTIIFGNDTLSNTSTVSDMFIVKYDATGNVLWAKSAGGTSYDEAVAVKVDALDNIIVTGKFKSNNISFGTFTLTNVNFKEDIFIVKYDAMGNVIWAKSSEDGLENDEPSAIAVDLTGSIIVTGKFRSSILTFDSITLTNSGIDNIFIAKYDSSGKVLWAKSAGGSVSDRASSVVVDTSNNIIVTGTFTSATAAFDSTILIKAGLADVFHVKYDSSGTLLWAKSGGGSSIGNGIGFVYSTIDLSGNSILTGRCLNCTSLTFDTTTLTFNGNNIFIIKCDTAGNIVWTEVSVDGVPNGIITDNSGSFFASGTFKTAFIVFGNTTLTNSNQGTYDFFVVKYDVSGNVLWAKSAGGNNTDGLNSITTDAFGSTVIVGSFYSPSITFGPTTITNLTDLFIAKLGVTSGSEALPDRSTLSIAPNPFIDQTTFTFSKEQKNIAIKLFDVTGKEIKSVNYSGTKFILEQGNLNAGVYFIKIQTSDGVQTQKVIVGK